MRSPAAHRAARFPLFRVTQYSVLRYLALRFVCLFCVKLTFILVDFLNQNVQAVQVPGWASICEHILSAAQLVFLHVSKFSFTQRLLP